MRITNQSYGFTILIVRCIDLVIFHRGNWQNNLILLTGKGGCLQMDGIIITAIGERTEQRFLDGRVGQRTNLIKLSHLVAYCKIKLLIHQILWLFGKKLRRKFISPFTPITFFGSFIDKREGLLLSCHWVSVFSIWVIIITLAATLFNR